MTESASTTIASIEKRIDQTGPPHHVYRDNQSTLPHVIESTKGLLTIIGSTEEESDRPQAHNLIDMWPTFKASTISKSS